MMALTDHYDPPCGFCGSGSEPHLSRALPLPLPPHWLIFWPRIGSGATKRLCPGQSGGFCRVPALRTTVFWSSVVMMSGTQSLQAGCETKTTTTMATRTAKTRSAVSVRRRPVTADQEQSRCLTLFFFPLTAAIFIAQCRGRLHSLEFSPRRESVLAFRSKPLPQKTNPTTTFPNKQHK